MSLMTGKAIAVDALQRALGWPASVLDTDTALRDFTLATINKHADIVWNMRSWDNEKVAPFQIQPDQATGIITFDPTVDIVRAMRRYRAGIIPDGYPIFSQDELISATVNNSIFNAIATDTYSMMADDANGNRRIKVDVITNSDSAQSYTVLALTRFVRWTVLNWSTVTFPIDRATTALIGYVADDIRNWQNLPVTKDGDAAMKVALDRDINQQNRDNRVVPRYPMFNEVGNW